MNDLGLLRSRYRGPHSCAVPRLLRLCLVGVYRDCAGDIPGTMPGMRRGYTRGRSGYTRSAWACKSWVDVVYRDYAG